jgi:hypothetical protein
MARALTVDDCLSPCLAQAADRDFRWTNKDIDRGLLATMMIVGRAETADVPGGWDR